MTMTRVFLTLMMFVLPVFAAYAVDEALYDPEPPADSAFVRLINAAGEKSVNGTLGDVSFTEVADVSPYAVLKAGTYDLSVGQAKKSVEVTAGTSYSFAYRKRGDKETLVSFEDAPMTDPSKAMMYFYNLSDRKAALRAPNFNTDILSGIAAGTSQSKALNALTVDVALTVDNADVAVFPGIALKRRTGYSFVIIGKAPQFGSAFVVNGLTK